MTGNGVIRTVQNADRVSDGDALVPMATLTHTSDLTKSFSGRTVVKGVNLEIASGEVVGPARPERRRQDDDVLDGRRA